MHLRENLRDYVARLNDESVRTGMPMLRPMMLEFPADAICQNNSAEAQFMSGPDWLVSPVTVENATSWPAYLPALPATGNEAAEWVYWWNQTVVTGGAWVSVDTTSIADYPLFFRRPSSRPPGIALVI